jgi:hypothetical protein
MAVPIPEPGLVISYSYLWHHEFLAGWEEGRKDRPAVIVFVARGEMGGSIGVTVLPITHSPPHNPAWGIEIPLPVNRHLGLDDARSWVVVAEGNDFLWPGYDLREVAKTGRYHHGFLPPRFFNQLLRAFEELCGAAHLTLRD